MCYFSVFSAIFLSITAPISAEAATTKVLGVNKTFTKTGTKVSGLSKSEKKIVKVTVNKSKKKVTVKGLKPGKASFKIGSKSYTVKVGAVAIKKKSFATSLKVGTNKKVTVTSSYGAKDTLKWSSSKTSVVKVSKATTTASAKKVATNTLKPVKAGSATITVKSKNTGKSLKVKVTVKAAQTTTTAPETTPTATVSGGATTAPGTTATPTASAEATTTPTTTTEATATPEPGKETSGPDKVATSAAVTVEANVTGASIKIMNGTEVVATTNTGDNKTATLKDIPNGTYDVVVSKDGYETTKTSVTVSGTDAKVEVTLAEELPTAFSAVKAVGTNRIQIDFTGVIDGATKDNFVIEGAAVSSAAVTADKKSVIIETTENLTEGKEYSITISGIVSKGEAVATAKATFKAKEIQYELKLTTAGDKTTIKSDGKETLKVTATLVDENGEVVKDVDQVEVEFRTTAGSFAETKVTVQNGVATNMFTSEVSTTEKTAQITATVVSAANKSLLNKTATRNITLSPNVNTEADQTVGASLTDVVVETADRVVLYFNKDVNVTDYTTNDGDNVYNYSAGKMKIEIFDKASNEKDSISESDATIAPYALAPVEGNTKALYAILPTSQVLTDNSKVVVKVTDKTKSVDAVATKSTLVSDIRVPSILGVENDGLRSIKVIFSEPVQSKAGNSAATTYNADDVAKWVIDGTKLNDDKYGVDGNRATVKVGSFDTKTGTDSRHIVTITLGKDKDGKQIYFKPGSHSVQGNKIGDWANLTDTSANIINTQTLDFSIAGDDTAPSATVTVDSPEQYEVTFNKYVDINEVTNNLELQKYDKTNAKWNKDTTNALSVKAIDEVDGTAKVYIVEVTTDWTQALKTKTSYVNYFNNDYRLHIDKDKITNLANGKTNEEQNLLLNDGIMTNPDVTSPEIKDVVEVTDGFNIVMSEPVQINLDDEVITPSETQGNVAGVPAPTVTFIKEDNSKSIPATIVKMVDDKDTTFKVKPATTLEAGKWKVVVSSISDDVGNTAQTLVKNDFEVKGIAAVETGFRVLWVVAVADGEENPITGLKNNSGSDMVYVKFNKQFKTYGGAANAVSTTNYTVNGVAVPSTSQIDSSLLNYNDKANTNGYSDLAAIHLNAGTLTSTSNTINISSTIESAEGASVENAGMKTLDKKETGVFTYNYKTADSTELNTIAKLKAALANDEYVVVSSGAITEDTTSTELTISRSGKYYFGNEFKSLTINTTETGTITVNGGKFTTVTVNAPNADVIIKDVEAVNMDVVDVLDGTLQIKNSKVKNVNITDNNNGCKLEADSASVIEKIVVDTTDKVTIASVTSSAIVTVKKAAELKVEASVAEVKIEASAKGATVTTTSDTTVTKDSSLSADDVKVESTLAPTTGDNSGSDDSSSEDNNDNGETSTVTDGAIKSLTLSTGSAVVVSGGAASQEVATGSAVFEYCTGTVSAKVTTVSGSSTVETTDLVVTPKKASATAADGEYEFTVTANSSIAAGTYTIEISAQDGNSKTVSKTATLVVTVEEAETEAE